MKFRSSSISSSISSVGVVWFVVLFIGSGIVEASDVASRCAEFPGLSYKQIGSVDETDSKKYSKSLNYRMGVGANLNIYTYQRNVTGTEDPDAQYGYAYEATNNMGVKFATTMGFMSARLNQKNSAENYGVGVKVKSNWDAKMIQFEEQKGIVMIPGVSVAMDALYVGYKDENGKTIQTSMGKRAEKNNKLNGRDVLGFDFDGLLQHDMTFTFSDLDVGETAQWHTYHLGVKQDEGTIEGTAEILTELRIESATGYDTVEVYIAEADLDRTDDDTISFLFQMIEYCLPASCDQTSMDIAEVYGDPHIQSFDGLKWDCMGGGLFEAFTGTKQDGTLFEIQAIFEKQTSKFGIDISLTRALAIDSGDPDQPIITISVPDTNENGCPYTVRDSATGIIQTTAANPFSTDQIVLKVREPKGTQKFEALEFSYLVTFTEVDITVTSSSTIGCYLNVAVCLGPDYWRQDAVGQTTSVTGLMGGQADDNHQNDWLLKDGGYQTLPAEPRGSPEAYTFCTQNWCITDESKSKFDYDKLGRSFAQDNKCDAEGAVGNFVTNIETNPSLKTEVSVCKTLYGDKGSIVPDDNYLKECYIEGANDSLEGIVNYAEGVAELNQTTLGEGIIDDIYAAGGVKQKPEEVSALVEVAIDPNVARGGVHGDPHFKTWAGVKYDYHGICDLMLINHPGFNRGVGMEIHIRSKKTKQWSYISTASIRIGSETLEVAGMKDGNSHWLNMVEIDQNMWEKNDVTIEGYPVYYQKLNQDQREYFIELGNDETIKIKTWKDMVRVDVLNPKKETFAGSLGLMGSYPTGVLLGRDGKTLFTDLNNFGQEWQVLSYEPNLFHIVNDGPQHPAQCESPTKTAMRRNLAESNISRKDAEIACAHVMKTTKEEFDLCVFDVMAIGDKTVAGAY